VRLRTSKPHGFSCSAPPEHRILHLRCSNSIPETLPVSPAPILTNRRILKERRSSVLGLLPPHLTVLRLLSSWELFSGTSHLRSVASLKTFGLLLLRFFAPHGAHAPARRLEVFEWGLYEHISTWRQGRGASPPPRQPLPLGDIQWKSVHGYGVPPIALRDAPGLGSCWPPTARMQ